MPSRLRCGLYPAIRILSTKLFRPLYLVHVYLPIPVLSELEVATRCAALLTLRIPTPPHWLAFFGRSIQLQASKICSASHHSGILLVCSRCSSRMFRQCTYKLYQFTGHWGCLFCHSFCSGHQGLQRQPFVNLLRNEWAGTLWDTNVFLADGLSVPPI